MADLVFLVAALLVWVALIYLLMAFGLRRGELVWSGRYPRMLSPELRRRSLAYGVLLVFSALTLWVQGGLISPSPIPDGWIRPAGWIATSVLAVGAVYSIVKGSRWERLLFLPITLAGAMLAGWFTFFA